MDYLETASKDTSSGMQMVLKIKWQPDLDHRTIQGMIGSKVTQIEGVNSL